jgi:hypothetical protein
MRTADGFSPRPSAWSRKNSPSFDKPIFNFRFRTCEFEESTVSIANELSVEGTASVLPMRIRSPDKLPLIAMRYKIDEMRDVDFWQRGFYRTVTIVSSLPFFLRRPVLLVRT